MRILLILIILFVFNPIIFAQKNVEIHLIDNNQEPISYASIMLVANKSFAIQSDSIGFCQLQLLVNVNYKINISAVGYNKKQLDFSITKDTSIQIVLENNEILQEVTIEENKFLKSSASNNNGVITITKNTLDVLPNIGGEKDIIKAIQLLPGVQSGNEGTRGIFIRGGSPDQTLILLDHTPIYNATHLYGFMSVFNGESIEDVQVYKNQYPARFGGRLGAVVDIRSNYGNKNKIKGAATIGLLSSRINLEGPLGKNKKTTFNLSLRGAYVGLYAAPISTMQFKKAGYDGTISYNFYDINFALSHRFSDKDVLFVSTFYSQDLFKFNRDKTQNLDIIHRISEYHYSNKVNWRNNTFNIQWCHEYNARFTNKLMFYISNYSLNNKFEETSREVVYDTSILENNKVFNNQNSISDYSIINEWNYTNGNNHFKVGLQVTYRPYQIGKGNFYRFVTDKRNLDTTYTNTLNKTLENTIYIEDEYKLADKININLGFHIVHYLHRSSNFFSFQPRMSLLYTPVKNVSIRASFITSTQNIHLLTSGSAIVLTDLWVPATQNLKPENAWQVSGGIQFDFFRQFQISVDAYYRKMNNVIEFKNGVNKVLIGDSWEKQIIGGGNGQAYGAEFYFSKTKGKFTAWMKYNLGWTYRQFEELNDGKKYFYKYDRRHDFSIAMAYKINQHFDLSLTWVYASGNWMSLWKSKYASQYSVDYYEFDNASNQTPYIVSNKERNNYRLPAYHHLDIGFNYTKIGKKNTHIVNVSIYNLYNNFNVFDVFNDRRYDKNGNEYFVTKALTLFPIIPSISYTIKF